MWPVKVLAGRLSPLGYCPMLYISKTITCPRGRTPERRDTRSNLVVLLGTHVDEPTRPYRLPRLSWTVEASTKEGQ